MKEVMISLRGLALLPGLVPPVEVCNSNVRMKIHCKSTVALQVLSASGASGRSTATMPHQSRNLTRLKLCSIVLFTVFVATVPCAPRRSRLLSDAALASLSFPRKSPKEPAKHNRRKE